jgi:hypothetical protein
MTGSVIGASAPSAELTTKSGTIRPVTDGENCGRSGKYPPRYWASNSGQLAASIRPVVSPAYSGQIAGHHPPRGLAANSRRESESIRPVNAIRRRPLSGSEFGEPGETTIRPAIAVVKAPQCPYPLTPRYRRENRGRLPRALSARYRRYWRPVTAPAATIPLAFGPFTSAPGNREHRGNCIRERNCLRMGPGSTVPLTGQLRPHREVWPTSAPLRSWLITPGLRHWSAPLTGQLRPQWRSVKSVGNTVKSH